MNRHLKALRMVMWRNDGVMCEFTPMPNITQRLLTIERRIAGEGRGVVRGGRGEGRGDGRRGAGGRWVDRG